MYFCCIRPAIRCESPEFLTLNESDVVVSDVQQQLGYMVACPGSQRSSVGLPGVRLKCERQRWMTSDYGCLGEYGW